MQKLQHVIDIATDGPLAPGVVAHRRASHTWYETFEVNGEEKSKPHHVLVGACAPRGMESAPAGDWREFSGGWALERGAAPCLAEACFPGGVQ